MDWNPELSPYLKLILAALLGSLIGLERETHGRYAGLRTNLLVSLGSCLLMMVSLNMAELFAHLGVDSAVRLDPGRVASYAVAGMGFIGAGVIVKGKGSVRGVTTAATLWTVTGIGVAVGAGYFLPAIATTVIGLLSLFGLRRLPFTRDAYSTLTLGFEQGNRPLDEIRQILGEYQDIHVQAINYTFDINRDTVSYQIHIRNRSDAPVCEIVDQLRIIPGLTTAAWDQAKVP